VNPLPPHLQPATTASGDAYERRAARDVRLQREPAAVDAAADAAPLRIFVAMSFREEEEPALADYYRAMERAAERVGHGTIELVRIDQVEGDYEISTEIMQRIDSCDAVLADFTLSARNVYFELGYARGVKKPVIQTARRGTGLEFDIRNWRTSFYRNATELEENLLAPLSDLLTKHNA
jgi:nucleoside 2-deoxyribosyltransferase